MKPGKIREGMAVRLAGPEGHPLTGVRGVVARVLSAEEMWALEPMTMLGDPFAWPDGQVLVSLDERPPWDGPGLWTPLVCVRPGEIRPA